MEQVCGETRVKLTKNKKPPRDTVAGKAQVLKRIKWLNEWSDKTGAELRIDESGQLKAVIELR
jgi:hypothetical protein